MNTKITDLESAEFQWKSDDMNMSTGGIAQEISDVFISTSDSMYSGIGITSNSASAYTISNTISVGDITFGDPYSEMEERLEKLEKIIAEEAELRSNHPAVKQAYDEYKLLATLAKVHSNGLTAK